MRKPSLLSLALASALGCHPTAPVASNGGAKPKAAASGSASGAGAAVASEPSFGPMPHLRTGALPRVDHPEAVHGRIVARGQDGAFEIVSIDLELPMRRDYFGWNLVQQSVVRANAAAGPFAFMAERANGPRTAGSAIAARVWIRRPAADKAAVLQNMPISGEIFLPADNGQPGDRFAFEAAPDPAVKSDPQLARRYDLELAQHIQSRGHSAWHAFAAAALRARNEPKPHEPARPGTRPEWIRDGDLDRLMETTTGMLSIQEALQTDRALFLKAAADKPTVPVGSLARPKSAPHPWEAMLHALGKTAPAEPLAEAVPAEFYYLRTASLPVFFQLADQLDSWATPVARALDGRAEDRDLARGYETQLGLARSVLARALGEQAVVDLALCGSDPYLREGSDLTVIFRVKNRALFDAGLNAALAQRAAEHGGLTSAHGKHDGVDVTVSRSGDGAVRQRRAAIHDSPIGDLEVVANSEAALGRVIDAIKGKRPRLSDEKDFQYELARDADTHAAALGFMGDRFVGEVVGPRQKIAEARRQIAAAELMTPSFAALLYGWLDGRAPKSLDEVVAEKLLTKEELARASEAAKSYGSPGALTPLIDLPEPDKVTAAEKNAYERFARSYEQAFSRYIDPAMLRISAADKALGADLRVLPLIDGSEYRDLQREAGEARVVAPPIGPGARAVIGIGKDAEVRRMLADATPNLLGRHPFKLDFLGEWAMAGVEDRANLADAVHLLDDGDLPELPSRRERSKAEDFTALEQLPLYAAVAIRSELGATLALTAIRELLQETNPHGLTWGEIGEERGVPIVRVEFRDRPESVVRLYYALTGGALYAALSERALARLIDGAQGGRGPRAASDPDGAQLAIDVGGEKGGAISTVLSWWLTAETLRSSAGSRALAEAIFIGAPDTQSSPEKFRALAVATFGAVPVPPEGGAYAFGQDGVRDPERGSESAPIFPPLPIAGSPVDRLLGAIGHFRSEVAFDREAAGQMKDPSAGDRGLQSLHAKVVMELR